MSFLKLIRFPNLLIVALTQYLVQYLLHIPIFNQAGLSPIFDHFHFALMVLGTMLIAASGYIINDLLDYEIDLINKPDRLIINRKIAASAAWKIYWSFLIIGFFIAIYLAHYWNNWWPVPIYLITVFLLWWYSYSLKRKVLSGNLVVALFCTFVPGVVAYVEQANYQHLEMHYPILYHQVFYLVGGYLVFAFSSTMLREIIKDMEDIKGDAQKEAYTLPVVYGLGVAKCLSWVFGIILLGVLSVWSFHESVTTNWIDILFLILMVAGPALYLFYKLAFAKRVDEFHHLSQVAKGIMVAGLVFLIVWYL